MDWRAVLGRADCLNRPLDFPRTNWAWSRRTSGISGKQQQARRQLVRGAVGVTRASAAIHVFRPSFLVPLESILGHPTMAHFGHCSGL
jgi:hypothetical protein